MLAQRRVMQDMLKERRELKYGTKAYRGGIDALAGNNFEKTIF